MPPRWRSWRVLFSRILQLFLRGVHTLRLVSFVFHFEICIVFRPIFQFKVCSSTSCLLSCFSIFWPPPRRYNYRHVRVIFEIAWERRLARESANFRDHLSGSRKLERMTRRERSDSPWRQGSPCRGTDMDLTIRAGDAVIAANKQQDSLAKGKSSEAKYPAPSRFNWLPLCVGSRVTSPVCLSDTLQHADVVLVTRAGNPWCNPRLSFSPRTTATTANSWQHRGKLARMSRLIEHTLISTFTVGTTISHTRSPSGFRRAWLIGGFVDPPSVFLLRTRTTTIHAIAWTIFSLSLERERLSATLSGACFVKMEQRDAI